MSELVKNNNGDWPKKKNLFSDKDINSNKILHLSWEELSDVMENNPRALVDILNKRNQYHNTKKE